MPRIPFFKLGSQAEKQIPPRLAAAYPQLVLEGLQVGVDNLRHDVHLSPFFVERMRLHIARFLARQGDVEGLLAAEAPQKTATHFLRAGQKSANRIEPSDLKPLLAEFHNAALNRAKSDGHPGLDLLARAAVIKFLRFELNSQFAQILERCRMMLKTYEGIRQFKALEYRERAAGFQVAKKIILRKTSQELYRTLRDIEKETLARTRRSLFGGSHDEPYKLFLNPLIFTEDAGDTYLNAEQYVMLGNFDRDPDRFANIRRIACDFLSSLQLEFGTEPERTLDGWLNVPENAQELVGGGTPDESTPEGRSPTRSCHFSPNIPRESMPSN